MRRFVGGVLADGDQRLLLVRRAASDPQMSGLWSLPAGGIESGESDEQALVREFAEETGLWVSVGARSATVRRPSWLVNNYLVEPVSGELTAGADPDVTDARYFGLDELPEEMVLEAHIGLIRHLVSSNEVLNAHTYTDVVDGLFSSLFHSYIRPSLKHLTGYGFLSEVQSVIRNTPRRKFKSAIPFLLSDLSTAAALHATVAEVLFALWTALDDVCDQRRSRYGHPSILQELGNERAVAFLFGAVPSLRSVLTELFGQGYADDVTAAMVTTSRSQYDFFQRNSGSRDTYLELAATRAAFLGVVWSAGLRTVGRRTEADFIARFQRESAKFGQLLNDYFDLRDPDGLSDLRSRRDSYYILRLYEFTSSRERRALERLRDAGDEHGALTEFRRLSRRVALEEVVREDARNLLDDLRGDVRASTLSADQQQVLTGWLDMSLRDVLPGSDAATVSFRDDITRFLDAFDSICQELR